MSTQTGALLLILTVMVAFSLIHIFAFIYDYMVPKRFKNTKFDKWWESLAWNSGQW